MKVLGIDPGLERLGWGLVEKKNEGIKYLKSGVKKTPKTKSAGARLLEIQNFLEELLKKERPELAAVETRKRGDRGPPEARLASRNNS